MVRRRPRIASGLFCLLCCLTIQATTHAADYRIRYLSPLPGDVSSYFYGMTNSGQVLGVSEGEDNSTTSVLWNADGTVVPLPWMIARCINNKGQIAGLSIATGDAIIRDADGTIRVLGQGLAQCMNDAGQVAGFAYTHTSGGELMVRAAIWELDGTCNVIDNRTGEPNSGVHGINNSGTVVGTWFSRTDYLDHGFMWSQDTGFVDLGTFDGYDFWANAISDDGHIVGVSGPAYYAVMRNLNGTYLRLSDVPYAGCTINTAGQVFINEGRRSLIINPDGSQLVLPGVDSWPDFAASAITDKGLIGGQCSDPTADRSLALVWEPVPEPPPALALACGLSFLGSKLFRKRRSARISTGEQITADDAS